MSLLKNALAKNYIGDIYEASYGFFSSVADEIEFVNPNKLSHAEKFRLADKYDVTTPIDIEKLLYETGLNVDTSFSLDDKTHGLICLFDGYIKSYNQLYLIKENTILIDREHIKNYGIGSYRFNILHEIVHFEYHKYYLTLKRQLAGIPYVVIDKEATLKNIEDQANKVASLLLVPSDELSKMLIDNYMKYDFYFAENKSEILIKISNSLSKYFNCSKTCMNQRIKAIGFYTADIDMTEIENKYISKNVIQEFCESKVAAKELCDDNNEYANVVNSSVTYYANGEYDSDTQTYSRTYRVKNLDSDEFFAHSRSRYYSYKSVAKYQKFGKGA